MSTRIITKNEADVILQGAVVLGCGGGGPLVFARKIISDMSKPARIQSRCLMNEGDWLAMIALVGSPSKVNTANKIPGEQVESESLIALTSKVHSMTVARRRWKQAINAVRTRVLRDFDQVDGATEKHPFTRTHSFTPDPDDAPFRFMELVRCAQRLHFFSSWGNEGLDEVDGEQFAVSPSVPVCNTFNYLKSQCQMRSTDTLNYPRFEGFQNFQYLLTGELGAVNMATVLLLSYTFDVSILDCDGAGRAVPFVNMITYANNLSVSPSVVVSPQQADDLNSIASVTMDFPRGKESLVEEILADLLVDTDGPFTPYVGYGTYVSRGFELKEIPVWDTYTKAMGIGEALLSATGHDRIAKIIETFSNYGIKSREIFHGFVTSKILQDNEARDLGHLTITSIDGQTMKLWYMNEFFIAHKCDENDPTVLAPDLIMMIPAIGPPLDLSSVSSNKPDKTELYILAAEASPKIKIPKIIENFEKVYKLFKTIDGHSVYTGRYIPIQFG